MALRQCANIDVAQMHALWAKREKWWADVQPTGGWHAALSRARADDFGQTRAAVLGAVE